MKKTTASPPVAWSSDFWIELQKQFARPNVRDGLLEADYVFRAILKKSANRIRIVAGGTAYWDDIAPAELAKWRMTMSLWGWGAKKIIVWNEELENDFLKASIRLFALHPDGPLPHVMCVGATRRKEWLLNKVQSKKDLPVWKRLNLQDTHAAQRFDYLAGMNLDDRNKLGQDVKEFYYAYNELRWKKKASERVYRWLLKKGTIPLAVATQWMQIWAWEETGQETPPQA